MGWREEQEESAKKAGFELVLSSSSSAWRKKGDLVSIHLQILSSVEVCVVEVWDFRSAVEPAHTETFSTFQGAIEMAKLAIVCDFAAIEKRVSLLMEAADLLGFDLRKSAF
jgi:hypothetical protein